MEQSPHHPSPASSDEHPTLLFDGYCCTCNAVVRFVTAHERAERVRFCAQQSARGREILRARDLERFVGESLVFIRGAEAFVFSDAAIELARELDAPYRWLAALRIVPRSVRDRIYGWYARNRYRIGGRYDECPLPTPAMRRRFIE